MLGRTAAASDERESLLRTRSLRRKTLMLASLGGILAALEGMLASLEELSLAYSPNVLATCSASFAEKAGLLFGVGIPYEFNNSTLWYSWMDRFRCCCLLAVYATHTNQRNQPTDQHGRDARNRNIP